MNAIVPIARCEMTVRLASENDYSFIDRLQAMHSKALGFMRRAALEGKIRLGEVLIAEQRVASDQLPVASEEAGAHLLATGNSQLATPIGYCISSYRYLKRDELGVVYQMNVAPGKQRSLVGAMLLKAVFDRAPYGCKLFCCWCAQDLDANYFWESLGFIPLAFRTGASGRSARGQLRTHIFWQRRVREGDVTTPYWFPSKTDGGMMREDRLVLPIPPGVHWCDPMPILLPEVQKALPEQKRSGAPAVGKLPKPQKNKAPVDAKAPLSGFSFAPAKAAVEKSRREKPVRAKVKADPKHVAAARELRDRWLEQFNSGLVLPQGKYEVSKQLPIANCKSQIANAPLPAPLLLEQAA